MYVIIDFKNNTFAIEPINKKISDFSKFEIASSIKEIKRNSSNAYTDVVSISGEGIENYINRYKNIVLSVPEIAYNLFDKEYREARFGTVENFKRYVEKNREEISKIRAISYLTEQIDDGLEVVIKDQYDNLYIFDVKDELNYTVKLDTYTLEQEKFNKAYKTATNREKAMMNIDKFFQMISVNDYTTSYKLLNDNFKNTYFPTEERFEQFMREYVYTHSNVTYSNFSDDISGVFTYHLELTDKSNEKNEKIKMNMVIQLLEGTDFRLSFEILK